MVSDTRKPALIVLVSAFLLLIVGLTPKIEKARAIETICIRTNGLIDPPTASILNDKNTTYTLTGNINASLIVERSDITIDGTNHAIQGMDTYNDSSKGVHLYNVTNVTVKNLTVRGFFCGIFMYLASNNTIMNCNLINNGDGIYAESSSNNSLIESTVTDSRYYGIVSYRSNYNTLLANNISSNRDYGIRITSAKHNHLSKNNITNNGGFGARIENSFNNTIAENLISSDYIGIWFYPSGNNTIFNNTIASNTYAGLKVEYSNSTNNSIQSNQISNNNCGLYINSFAGKNTIQGNTIANNTRGIQISSANNNTIFHNNLINNTQQVSTDNSLNIWDNGIEGNHWSNYTGADADNDGIGDSIHSINENNTDNHPLMGMFYDFRVEAELGHKYNVQAISNSTLQSLRVLWWLSSPNQYLQPGQKHIQIMLEGETNTTGFCRMTIPRNVLNGTPYIVLVDGHEIPTNELATSNSTQAIIYFTYQHSQHEIIIIPELSATKLLPILILATMLPNAILKKRTKRRNSS